MRRPRSSRRPRGFFSHPVGTFVEPVEPLEQRTLLSTYTVTNTADEGPGSLRQALLDATYTGGGSTIKFDIPGPGVVHTISPASPLPPPKTSVTIDGTTEPGYAGSPLIELDGSGAGSGVDGLVVTYSTVRGLAINRFSGNGIVAGDDARIQSNYIGTDASGTADLGNGGAGIVVSGDFGVTIGGARIADGGLGLGNVISGNGAQGICIGETNSRPSGTVVAGNYIGTNAAGTAAIGNDAEGIVLVTGDKTQIGTGKPGEGNVISGNGASGIRLAASTPSSWPGVTGTTVRGNLIGTDAAGAHALGNGASPTAPFRDGVTSGTPDLIIGTPQFWPVPGLVYRNVISANAGAGVRVSGGASSTLEIAGNYVGTDASGTAHLGNGIHGLWLNGVSFSSRVKGNVVSGNGGDGVRVDAGPRAGSNSTVTLEGNYIGTAADGLGPLGNAGHGVHALGPVSVTVGGRPSGLRATPVALFTDIGNLISANGGDGVRAEDAPPGDPNAVAGKFQLTVRGNFIGTDAAGNVDLGNGGNGVTVDGRAGGPGTVLGNLVSGNAGDGIHYDHYSAFATPTVGGNFVGTNAAGTAAVRNDGDGLEFDSSRNFVVGGTMSPFARPVGIDRSATAANLISGNAGNGIRLTGTPAAPAAPQIIENYIGTDYSGNVALGNGGSGIYIDGSGAYQIGTPLGSGNVISGNAGDGVTIVGPAAGGVLMHGNWIGTGNVDSAGVNKEVPVGNGGNGVTIIDSSNNTVTSFLSDGAVANNHGGGVVVRGESSQNNSLYEVPVYDNGALGIDLGDDGVTPNDPLDADAGPNGLQNFPVIQSAVSNGAGTEVKFEMHAAPNTSYSVDFYSSASVDPSGYGEGEEFAGAGNVTTDAEGNGSGVAQLNLARNAAGRYFTAIARVGPRPGPTSEFSAPVRATEGVYAAVVGRHAFYNRSAFDGNDGGANAGDDAAVAPDKQALLPGQAGTFANVTSYSRGLNGIMVDIANLSPRADTRLTAEDFQFRAVGAGPGAATSTPVAPPSIVTLRRGAGDHGSDRITLVWPDYNPAAGSAAAQAMANGWLEVTVWGGEETGLRAPDVFYFGNLIAESGDAPSPSRITAADLGAVKNALNSDATLASRVDFNRDGKVNALDLGLAKANLNRSVPPLTAPVPAPAPAPASEARRDDFLAGLLA